jgi:hypothetical protein
MSPVGKGAFFISRTQNKRFKFSTIEITMKITFLLLVLLVKLMLSRPMNFDDHHDSIEGHHSGELIPNKTRGDKGHEQHTNHHEQWHIPLHRSKTFISPGINKDGTLWDYKNKL